VVLKIADQNPTASSQQSPWPDFSINWRWLATGGSARLAGKPTDEVGGRLHHCQHRVLVDRS
jgi:hypothetical protein